MLCEMSCWDYCRWYLHYLKEPWGIQPISWYLSQILWATMANVIPVDKMPKPKDMVFDLLREKDDLVDEAQIKSALRMLSTGDKNGKAD